MKTYTLQLTIEQIKMLGAGLGELPTKHGMPLTMEINRQIAAQEMKASPEVLGDTSLEWSKQFRSCPEPAANGQMREAAPA